LLGITISIEQPELEVNKHKSIENENNLKIKINELEKSLLNELAKENADILNNIELSKSLSNIKLKVKEIKNSLLESQKISEQIDDKRNQ